MYLKPLKRNAIYGVPVCDLQLRSYSIRNLEQVADFALRAAYYLNLPASGPIPLPRIVERWTVPRSNFVHKKSQENFERITVRRLIQVQDSNVESVQIWLAFIRKHAYYGVGMKANVWEYEQLGSAAFASSLSETAKIVNRSWQSNGYEAGEPEKRPGTTMGSFWETKDLRNFGEGFPDDGKSLINSEFPKSRFAHRFSSMLEIIMRFNKHHCRYIIYRSRITSDTNHAYPLL